MKKKIYSFNTELYKVTGIQRVMMDIHNAVKEDYDSRIVGTITYDRVASNIGIEKDCYIKLHNPFMFYKSVVIIHERKLLPIFWILNHFLLQRIKVVYIHHNVFYDYKLLSRFPHDIIAISDDGIKNLTEFFKVPMNHITKIHNCVRDICPPEHKPKFLYETTVLYPARINDVKRQCEIVEHLRGKIDKRVKIFFAGTGPLFEQLTELCKKEEQFEVLGFCPNIPAMLQECDFMMLFSLHEGLSITLIEATMCGTPIICNNVGGNTEIAFDKENAIVIDNWEELIITINSLVCMSDDKYKQMSQNSRRVYEKYYTFEQFKKQYIKILKRL